MHNANAPILKCLNCAVQVYSCDCTGCSCPGEPEFVPSYCMVGNVTDKVKCHGVEVTVMNSRIECELTAIASSAIYFAWSEDRTRCQVMNSTDETDGDCHPYAEGTYLLYQLQEEGAAECLGATKDHEVGIWVGLVKTKILDTQHTNAVLVDVNSIRRVETPYDR